MTVAVYLDRHTRPLYVCNYMTCVTSVNESFYVTYISLVSSSCYSNKLNMELLSHYKECKNGLFNMFFNLEIWPNVSPNFHYSSSSQLLVNQKAV